MKGYVGEEGMIFLRQLGVDWDGLAGTQGGGELLQVSGAGVTGGVDVLLRDVVPLQPLPHLFEGLGLPIATPLRVDV